MAEPYKDYLDGHALLERFKAIAPASLKHCQNVASMCEAVAIELPDLDRELLKVAALYHDVGKLMHPQYFSENQNGGGNPHDELDPHISYLIITRHVSDSAALLAQYHFPQEVIDIVMQHHGNSVVQSFFDKADTTEETNFRYKWDPPQTTEAAILMVADRIEATAKSRYASGKLDKEGRGEFVHRVIEELIEDDQLDRIAVGVLKVLRRVIPRELDSLYHKRVDFEEEAKAGKKK